MGSRLFILSVNIRGGTCEQGLRRIQLSKETESTGTICVDKIKGNFITQNIFHGRTQYVAKLYCGNLCWNRSHNLEPKYFENKSNATDSTEMEIVTSNFCARTILQKPCIDAIPLRDFSAKRSKRPRLLRLRVLSSANELGSVPPELAWQAAVGAVAGVTPFIIAGVEFGKRIVKQKKCSVCNGSGLVQKGKYYFRCYNCGGFLPWQSWKRFFSG